MVTALPVLPVILILWPSLTQVEAFQIRITPQPPVILGQSATFTIITDPGDPKNFSLHLTKDSNPNNTLLMSGTSVTQAIPKDQSSVGGWTIHVQSTDSQQELYNFGFQIIDSESDPAHSTQNSSRIATPIPLASVISGSTIQWPTAATNVTVSPSDLDQGSTSTSAKSNINTKIVAGTIAAGSAFCLICIIFVFVLWARRRKKRLQGVIIRPTGGRPQPIEPFLEWSVNRAIKRLKGALPEETFQDGTTNTKHCSEDISSCITPLEILTPNLKTLRTVAAPDITQKSPPIATPSNLASSPPPIPSTSAAEDPNPPVDSSSSLTLFISDRHGRMVPIKETDRVFTEFGVLVGITTPAHNRIDDVAGRGLLAPPSYTSR